MTDLGLFDLAVIGGGVNGCGIARDAAGRGLSVLLVEQDDLAAHTSSASTKLIHGGLRYLEQRQFRLVREALAEREVLLHSAPHLIRPLRFVLPHRRGLRPWWMLRAGLFAYDHLGGRRLLPGTRTLDLRRDPAGVPLKPTVVRGLAYSDCGVDDSRLVVLLARDAADRRATIRTRTPCLDAARDGGTWRLKLQYGAEAGARALVNAAGPWVGTALRDVAHRTTATAIRLVKGSHIVTRRLFEGEDCYILQNGDGRVCFALPYERDFTLIGTTDEDYRGDPATPSVSPDEERYLLGAVAAWMQAPPMPADIVWRFAGVRPLRDDGRAKPQDATRDYVLELDAPDGAPPLLSVFGGKLTTFRRLAEAALARLAPSFPGLPGAWTASAHLPGGDFAWNGAPALLAELRGQHPFLPEATAWRLVHAYGTRAARMLEGARRTEDLGLRFSADLSEREVEWLRRTEWAHTAEDILWRRSKLGLRLSPAETSGLRNWMAAR
jgi:glycerol-3-phosphate dehydrogenase